MSMLSTSVLRGVDEIGPYQILEDLGPAPFGLAYLALDSRTDQRAILKVIPPSRPGLLQEETPWDVLLKETRALLRIHHRGIPPLFEIAEQDGMLLVSFGTVVGSTLHDLMVQGKRPNRGLLVDWGCQLLEILAEAHAAGIVHRHVSEDQIVVTPDGRLVLMGFGLTQIHFDPLAAFPPERSPGEPLTPQSDLYAVGLLLRRLAFASGLRGGARPGSAAARSAAQGAGAGHLPQSGGALPRRPRDGRRAPPGGACRSPGARAAPGALHRAVPIPGRSSPGSRPRPEPPKAVQERSGRTGSWRLLLVTAAVVLMLMLIAAGWFLIGRDGIAQPVLPAGTAASTIPGMPSPPG